MVSNATILYALQANLVLHRDQDPDFLLSRCSKGIVEEYTHTGQFPAGLKQNKGIYPEMINLKFVGHRNTIHKHQARQWAADCQLANPKSGKL